MRWTLKPNPNKAIVENLAKELSIDNVLAKILVQRGVTTFDEAKRFFRPSLSDLHNPYLMKDMSLAVKRIEKAIENKENILIFGDYDVDGTTAVSLVFLYLKTFYQNIATYIPDRYDEGYGVSFKGIDFAHDNNFKLIIALDCGIKAVDKVAYAKQKGIDFVICDHHNPSAELPKAVAILNPKQPDCNYPYKELCGCGVGFKLIQAIAKKKGQPTSSLIKYLDLVATAIAADIVPITGENRVLTFFGLKVINSNPRSGIKAIIKHNKKEKLNVTDVVFGIAPRINAAGRMKHGNYAVELLTEPNFKLATKMAEKIEKFNLSRRELDKKITKSALFQIESNNETKNFTTVVCNEKWHKGVIGIVASKLTETYYRPTIVFTKSKDKLAASARSVKGYNLYNAIEQCSEFIEQFGGHKYAAGLTILPENYQKLKQKFEQVVKKSIDKKLLTPEILIDAELNLENITPKFFRIIEQMAPFGPKNMRPVFLSKEVRDNGFGKQVGADKSHLKLTIFQGLGKNNHNAIGFGLGNKIDKTNNKFNIAFTLNENEWNGNKSIQLNIKDITQSI